MQKHTFLITLHHRICLNILFVIVCRVKECYLHGLQPARKITLQKYASRKMSRNLHISLHCVQKYTGIPIRQQILGKMNRTYNIFSIFCILLWGFLCTSRYSVQTYRVPLAFFCMHIVVKFFSRRVAVFAWGSAVQCMYCSVVQIHDALNQMQASQAPRLTLFFFAKLVKNLHLGTKKLGFYALRQFCKVLSKSNAISCPFSVFSKTARRPVYYYPHVLFINN